MAATVKGHDRMIGDIVEAEGGEVFPAVGDAVHAVFASPVAALRAALAVKARIAESDWGEGVPPAVRIALCTGDAEFANGEWRGVPVDRCGQLRDSAGDGQILLCAQTVARVGQLLPEPISVAGLGLFVPGSDVPERLFELGHPAGGSSLLASPAFLTQLSTLPLPEDLSATGWTRFVGRQDVLQQALAAARTSTSPRYGGHGTEGATVFWVLGEPGVGKTRFAAEVATRAHDRGALVLFGRCDELVQDPYQPFVGALRWYVNHRSTAELGRSLGRDPAPLVRLVPELGGRFPSMLDDIGRATEVEQQRLFESVLSWLTDLGANYPVVLVVDDVHWADRPTLAMLLHVLRNPGSTRLLILGTARDTDPDTNDVLSGIVDQLGRTGRSHRLRLAGLDARAVASLISDSDLDVDGPELMAERIVAETAGNPLFIGAILASLKVSGRGEDSGHPGDVVSAVRNRVRRLDPGVQDVLQVAALIGLEFSLLVTAGARGIAEGEALTSLESAVRAGLVDEIGVNRFRFAHALVRDVLSADVSASCRSRLHADIVASIQRTFAHDLDPHLRSLAHHCAASELSYLQEKAIDFARSAAKQAILQVAFPAAVDDLTFALEVADWIGAPVSTRYDLTMAMGEAQGLSGLHHGCLATFERAAELARTWQDWTQFARAAVAYEEVSWRPGSHGHQALRLLTEAAGHPLEPELDTLVNGALARALAYCGEADEGARRAVDVLQRARALGDREVLLHAIDIRTGTVPRNRPVELDDMLALLHEALDLEAEIAGTGRLTTDVAGLMANLVQLHLERGEIADALFRLSEAERSTRGGSMRFRHYIVSSLKQVLAFCSGDFEAAETHADELLNLGQALGDDVSGSYGLQMFLIRREQDRLEELAPLVRAILNHRSAENLWLPGLVALLAEIGMIEETKKLLDDYTSNGFAALPPDAMFPAALCLLSEASVRVDAQSAGEDLASMLEPWTGRGVSVGATVGFLGPADRYLGLLATLRADTHQANKYFASALDLSRRLRSPVWTAHTLADWATLAHDTLDPVDVTAYADEARQLAQQFSLLRILRQLGLGHRPR